ncbi:Tm-1-like ATP-binding domain-containing protein [Luethyella okanaganae]|uniref:Tm-1-like ATP-binding domain-containing protein n=1 Tax=Luethyella okanaganae TaxID=69372 RepID=A0ABW1VKC9_9MICO
MIGTTAPASDAPRVAVVATLDTKGLEARYLVERLHLHGVQTVLVDTALTGASPRDADVTRAMLATLGATDAAGDDRASAMETTAHAAGTWLAREASAERLDGVIGIGGGTGGWISQEAFAELPFGFPKLVLTTVVKSSGENDITLMPSVVDVAGLNSLLCTVLDNAAAAIAGMACVPRTRPVRARRTIAMTMFGVTTTGGDIVRRTLEEAGCDVVVFHATGAGGRTMERLIADGRFDGVVDWTTTEVTDHLVGGLCDAGPLRLEAAGVRGVPQLIVPGAVDVINVPPPVPDRYADRAIHWHLPTVPLVRTSRAESAAVGSWIAEKLNRSTGPVAVLIPRGGFSSLDAVGGVFADADADAAFDEAVRATIHPSISVTTTSDHINDEAFARLAASTLLRLLDTASPKE